MGPFLCVNDGVPEESIATLRAACAARAIAFVEIEATRFDYDPARRAGPGSALFRPATSAAAMHVERFLWQPGVRTFHRTPDALFRVVDDPVASLLRAGVPMPASVPCTTAHRGTLRGHVDRLGGFPLVAKTGGEGGVGVLLLESLAGLYSFVDFALARGVRPLLTAFVHDAEHWRVIVVGHEAVAAYRNVRSADDFRSYPSAAREDYTAAVDPPLAALAVRAAHALDVDFGGVDILVSPDARGAAGEARVIECNFPCYYPQAQTVGGIDVAGPMVDWLTRPPTVVAAPDQA